MVDILPIYITPLHKIDVQAFEEATKSLVSSVLIIDGDFNAHHPSWGYSSFNMNGRAVLLIAEQCFLNISNNCTYTTFPTHNFLSSAIIDLRT